VTEIPVPASVESQSVLSEKKREVMYYAYRHFQRAVRKDNFKLIKYQVNGVETIQVFDLKNDPWEINNLANNPTYSNQAEVMMKLLREPQAYECIPLKK
jgi:arylsulfatase A-like enzyme